MPDLTQLEKLAYGAALQRLGHRALAGGGAAALGGALGAGVGGLVGGVRGYRAADAAGQSGAQGALRGALQGAGRGLGIGAAAGAVGGLAGGERAQKMVLDIGRRKDTVGGLARFGQTQVHSLTGALPAGMSKSQGLQAIGASPVARVQAALREQVAKKGVDSPAVDSLLKGERFARRTEELGMTNVPGLFKALATKPGEALKAGLGREWYGNPTVAGKAMALGVPAALMASEAATPSSSDTRAGTALKALGSGSVLALAPMGMTGSILASSALGGIGRRVGNTVGKRPPHSPAPPEPELGNGVATPAEHVYSPRVTGGFS